MYVIHDGNSLWYVCSFCSLENTLAIVNFSALKSCSLILSTTWNSNMTKSSFFHQVVVRRMMILLFYNSIYMYFLSIISYCIISDHVIPQILLPLGKTKCYFNNSAANRQHSKLDHNCNGIFMNCLSEGDSI